MNKKNDTKQAVCTYRCTPEFKTEVETFAKCQNTSPSILIRSVLQIAINTSKTDVPLDTDLLMRYNLKFTIALNEIYNTICLDPNIPAKTKEKIREELDSLAKC